MNFLLEKIIVVKLDLIIYLKKIKDFWIMLMKYIKSFQEYNNMKFLNNRKIGKFKI